MSRFFFRKHDIIIYAAILLFALAAVFIYHLKHFAEGDTVVVSIDGEKALSYPLSYDMETDIYGFRGGTVHLAIHDGKADVTDADCPDRICVKHSPIAKNGESIVCLPSRIIISIEEKNDSEATVDGVTR